MTLTVKNPAESPRSNPVCLEVSVVVRSLPADDTGNPPIREEARTVIVFDNGAVLRSANKLPIGQTVIVSNPSGRDVVCKIVTGRNLPSVKGYVEVQFVDAVNDFWGIHQSAETVAPAPVAAVPAAVAPSNAAPIPQTPPAAAQIAPRAVVPSQPALKQQDVSLGSGPSFEDIPGLVSRPSSGAPREPKSESSKKPVVIEAANKNKDVSNYNLSESAKPTSLSNWQSATPESAAENRATFSPKIAPKEDSSGALSSSQPRDFMSKGLMAYEQADSSPNDSKKRVPLIIGIAALVLAGVGGLVFFLRGGSEPAAVATTAAVSQSSIPAEQSAAEPIQRSQQAPIQQATEAGSPSQLQAQPVVEQSRTAVSAVPAVVTGAANSDLRTGSGLDSRNAKLEKNETAGRDSEPTSSRRPSISNLKMGAPKAPNKKLSGAGDLNAPNTDVASAQAVGSLAPAGLLTAAGRISSQPAPPPSLPGSSPATTSAVISAASAPIPASKTVQDPKLISSPRLAYPQAARQSNIQGTVTLALNIDANGKVVGAEAVSGPLLLRQPAIDSVKQWKYSPGLLDGKPSPSQTTVKVEFRLN